MQKTPELSGVFLCGSTFPFLRNKKPLLVKGVVFLETEIILLPE